MSAFESEEDPEQDERGDVLHTNLQNINSNPTFFPPQDIRRRTSLPIQFYNRWLLRLDGETGTWQITSLISVEEFLLSEDQHAVSVTEEAVTFLDRFLVGPEQVVSPTEGRDEHH